jgi:drug/metabolite transporter (DMT)-like permease
MVLSAFAFSLMTAFVKLAGRRLPWQELVVARAALTLVFSYAWLRAAKVAPFGKHRGMLIVRGVFGFLGLSSVYYAATHLPLAEATVIQYLYPPLTLLIASVFLREPMDRRVVFSMLLGVVGLILVAQPAALFGRIAAPLDPGGLIAAFLGAFFSACAYVTVRTLGQEEHPLVIVFYFPLVALPASLLSIGSHAIWPERLEWCWLILLGVCTQVGQVSVTRGFASAPAGRMAVYSYVQVLFAGVWGALFFHERPKPLSLAGAALILTGALFNLRTSAASPKT